MWIKLGNEYVNLDHIIRVRFTKAFKKDGNDEWTADLEGFVRGELQMVFRYKGTEAQTLNSIFGQQLAQPSKMDSALQVAVAAPHEVTHASIGTVHDLKIP